MEHYEESNSSLLLQIESEPNKCFLVCFLEMSYFAQDACIGRRGGNRSDNRAETKRKEVLVSDARNVMFNTGELDGHCNDYITQLLNGCVER